MQEVAVPPRAVGVHHSKAPIEKVENSKVLFDQLLKKHAFTSFGTVQL